MHCERIAYFHMPDVDRVLQRVHVAKAKAKVTSEW